MEDQDNEDNALTTISRFNKELESLKQTTQDPIEKRIVE
jgi:hypothetical protein